MNEHAIEPSNAFSVQNENSARALAYLTWLHNARKRQSVTVYQYAGTLASFLDWIEPTDLGAVTPEVIEAWLERPRKGRGHGRVGAAATLAKNLATLRSMYTFLLARGLVATDPTLLVAAPPIHNRQPRAISDATWLALMADPHVDLVDNVALGLGFYVGLRRKEIMGLAPHHVLDGRLVGFERKGGVDDITPYRDMLDALAEKLPHLGAGGWEESFLELCAMRSHADYLIPWGDSRGNDPWTTAVHELAPGMACPDAMNHRMKKLCRQAGIQHVTPHALRHSTCTNLLRAGVPLHIVSNLMNHSSLSVTTRYIKSGGRELREWLQLSAR